MKPIYFVIEYFATKHRNERVEAKLLDLQKKTNAAMHLVSRSPSFTSFQCDIGT